MYFLGALMDQCCGPESGPQFKSDDDRLVALCKAMGNPVRAKIVRILIKKGECISGDIAEEFDLERSSVSEQLKVLKDVGLIQGSIDGKNRCYCINTKTMQDFKKLVSKL